MADQIIFLPGAGGDENFWAPVESRIAAPGERVRIAWPGFAGSPHDSSVASLHDLVPLVERHLAGSATLIAQSMGGVVAVLTAIAYPERVSRLVLVAMSGGVDMARFGAIDWRPRHLSERGETPPQWFVNDRTDLESELTTLVIPTLLIYGDSDEIAPVAAGEFLQRTLPCARLEVVTGGTHDMAERQPDELAALINGFLSS